MVLARLVRVTSTVHHGDNSDYRQRICMPKVKLYSKHVQTWRNRWLCLYCTHIPFLRDLPWSHPQDTPERAHKSSKVQPKNTMQKAKQRLLPSDLLCQAASVAQQHYLDRCEIRSPQHEPPTVEHFESGIL